MTSAAAFFAFGYLCFIKSPTKIILRYERGHFELSLLAGIAAPAGRELLSDSSLNGL
jgi:hypothetical protein